MATKTQLCYRGNNMSKQFQRVRGMQDVLPPTSEAWQYVSSVFAEVCEQAGFRRAYLPALEQASLFERSIGEATEVVHKELYRFEDRGGDMLALKPESTAGIVRSYIENGLGSWPSPVNLFCIEAHFRYDRPQAGRYRQHHQLDLESFGVRDPFIDASIIALAARLFDRLGLSYRLKLNTIGQPQDRQAFGEALQNYLKPNLAKLPELVQKQLQSNPLRVLDSKDSTVMELLDEAPNIAEFLSEDSKQYFAAVQQALQSQNIEFELDLRLVRGLDYYNDTVFEFKGGGGGAQDSIGGGGRYDGLVEMLGGQPTPAFGFGLGLERVVLELEKQSKLPDFDKSHVMLIGLGQEQRAALFGLQQELLQAGISVVADFSTRSLSSQLNRANKLGIGRVVILGEQELSEQKATLRDLKSGEQQTLSYADLIDTLS